MTRCLASACSGHSFFYFISSRRYRPTMNLYHSTAAMNSNRLASLDILRGFDLFMLLFFQPVLMAIGRAADSPVLDSIMYHFEHETWEGFRAWDLVMPLFLFMVGASMPFAFAKYRRHDSAGLKAAYHRIGRRVVLLFLFGMIVQGNLLALDPAGITIYTNTLQAIAAGYLIAAMCLLHLQLRGQIIATAALLIIYWLPMRFAGDYTLEGSFAYMVDALVIGDRRGDPTYTWVWSSLTFGVTVMLGVMAGHLMKNDRRLPRPRVALLLTAAGAGLVAAGLLWSLEEPIIKRIWTSSMTLYSGGICFLLMALAYWWVDCRGHSRGLGWLKIYGMNPITAYVIGEVISFRSVVASVSYGLQHHIGDAWYAAWLTFGNCLILYLILWLMYRSKLFLKL